MIDLPLLNFLLGGAGALVKLCMDDDGIAMPNVKDGKLYLGGISGLIIGAVAGVIANNNPLSAFLGGYAGTGLISNLVKSGLTNQPVAQPTVEEQIRTIAKQNGVDPDLAVRVAKCESNLNPQAININVDNSEDRGLFQINNKYHPGVTSAQAFDITFSTQFFCTAFKAGNLSWWNASKKCWEK
jgi:hypothetical protein